MIGNEGEGVGRLVREKVRHDRLHPDEGRHRLLKRIGGGGGFGLRDRAPAPEKMRTEQYFNRTDEELIQLLRDGDGGVMDFIMEKYKGLVRSKAKSMYLLGGGQRGSDPGRG